jgi:hypothetical protein
MAKTTKRQDDQPDATRVSFRLDDNTAAELGRRAGDAGTSPSLFARDLLVAAMAKREEERQEDRLGRHELVSLRTQIKLLRGDFASSVAIMLAKAGKLQPTEANDWVRRTLLDHQE